MTIHENDTSQEILSPANENVSPEEPIPAAAAPPEDYLSDIAGESDASHTEETPLETVPGAEALASQKPKRASRKKKAEEAPAASKTEPAAEERQVANRGTPLLLPQNEGKDSPSATVPQIKPPPRKKDAPILTLDIRGDVETQDDRDDAIWHEIHNAYRTHRILTGPLGGIEQTDGNKTIVIVDYKGFRIVIPIKEMMITLTNGESGQAYTDLMLRQNKLLGKMLGAEIDFIVRGIDSNTRSIVASRRDAMLKKRQTFYMDKDANGVPMIHVGRLVQARVIAVAEKAIRVEIFGVECSIMARDLAWFWIGDAHEYYAIGDNILVRILSVRGDTPEELSVKADVRSVTQDNSRENLKKCRVQSKYAGRVTDVHKGVVYIRLTNGVNAVAHSCYDYRTPGKKDDVSFAVTKLDEERGVAVGIITRIIRQNL